IDYMQFVVLNSPFGFPFGFVHLFVVIQDYNLQIWRACVDGNHIAAVYFNDNFVTLVNYSGHKKVSLESTMPFDTRPYFPNNHFAGDILNFSTIITGWHYSCFFFFRFSPPNNSSFATKITDAITSRMAMMWSPGRLFQISVNDFICF